MTARTMDEESGRSGRRARPIAFAIARVFALCALAAGGCSWLHDDYPDRRCRESAECFRAQGEICDVEAGVCVAGPDAAPEESFEPAEAAEREATRPETAPAAAAREATGPETAPAAAAREATRPETAPAAAERHGTGPETSPAENAFSPGGAEP